ncbi:MAG: hypothetical protein ACRDHD_02010 [Candidatus Limnocylindria bacterium]
MTADRGDDHPPGAPGRQPQLSGEPGLESPPGPPAPPPSGPPRPPRVPGTPPSAYRPDLRPMLILAGLLVGVVVGWLVLGPLILPAAR